MKQPNKQRVDIASIIKLSNVKAVIFDLDGTILDNNTFHLKSWLKYLKSKNIDITQEEFNQYMNGRTNKDAIQYIYKRKMPDEEITRITLEKEAVYRAMYAPYITPVRGFYKLLTYLRLQNIKMAIATSGIQPNIDFMFEYLPVRQYFDQVVNSSHITHGKPDPEIYLLTAELMNIPPDRCLVFEDAVPGIQSAKAAGMSTIALTTTDKIEALGQADWIINDYEDLFQKKG